MCQTEDRGSAVDGSKADAFLDKKYRRGQRADFDSIFMADDLDRAAYDAALTRLMALIRVAIPDSARGLAGADGRQPDP